MKRVSKTVALLLLGAFLGAMLPVQASPLEERRQNRRIRALQITVNEHEDKIEDLYRRLSSPGDQGTVNSRLDTLERQASQLGSEGRYWGVVNRFQVQLSQNDQCSNGQPRTATWDTDNLAC